jgi:hypothetical protein
MARKFPRSTNRLLAVITGFVCLSSASAADITWIGTGSADFNLASNWNPAQVPTGTDLAYFNNNLAPGTVNLSAAAGFGGLRFNNTAGSLYFRLNGNTLTATSVLMTQAAGEVNAVTISGGTLSNTTFNIGASGSVGSSLNFTGLNTTYISTSTSGSTVGPAGSNDNLLLIDKGAYFQTQTNVFLGSATSTGNRITIDSSRFTIIGGNRGVILNQGTLTITNSYANVGTISAAGAGNVSWVNFNSGTMMSRRTTITNGQPFTVGDGGAIPATFTMVSGNPTASFSNGLILNSNGRLTGGYSLNPIGTATPALITGNISGVAGAKVNPSSLGQPQITSDDVPFGRVDVTGNYDNTNIETTLDIWDFPRQLAAVTTTFDAPTDRVNISGNFTHGGSVKIDLFDYVPPQDQDYTQKVLGYGSQIGSSASTALSFINGSTPLVYAWQSDGLYVTAAKVTLPMSAWSFNGSENWSNAANWTAGAVNGVDSVATFSAAAITAAATVTLDAPQTVGRVVFGGTNPYALTGGTLTLDVSAIGTARIRATSGSHLIQSPITLSDDTGIDASSGATITISGAITGGSNRVVKMAPGVVVLGKLSAGQLDVNDGTLKLSGNGTASGVAEITGVSYGDLARLDVGDNGLVVNYTASDPSAGIRSALASGYYGGAWTGPGIMSSTSGGATGMGVGYARTADTGAITAFNTIPVDSTTVVVRRTYNGDGNLDGKVNTVDFNHLAGGFGSGSPGWLNGDYDYDNDVDSIDFNALAANYGKVLPGAAPGLGSVVPEPAALSVVALAGLALRRRR